MATIKKAQFGERVGRARGQKCGLEKAQRKEDRYYERENRRADRQADREARREARRAPNMRYGGKAKKGGSFPDLTGDGKVTRADILKGRGVIAKGGLKLKKQAAIAIAMKAAGKKPKKARGGATLSPSKSSTSNRLSSYGRPLGKNLTGKLKTGGKVKKAMGGMSMGKCRGGCY